MHCTIPYRDPHSKRRSPDWLVTARTSDGWVFTERFPDEQSALRWADAFRRAAKAKAASV
jgi:hypothetical protein